MKSVVIDVRASLNSLIEEWSSVALLVDWNTKCLTATVRYRLSEAPGELRDLEERRKTTHIDQSNIEQLSILRQTQLIGTGHTSWSSSDNQYSLAFLTIASVGRHCCKVEKLRENERESIRDLLGSNSNMSKIRDIVIDFENYRSRRSFPSSQVTFTRKLNLVVCTASSFSIANSCESKGYTWLEIEL